MEFKLIATYSTEQLVEADSKAEAKIKLRNYLREYGVSVFENSKSDACVLREVSIRIKK